MIREKDIITELDFLKVSLQRVHSELEKIKKSVPEGVRLRAVRHGKGYQYFMRRYGIGGNGEYISKKNIKTAVILAQIEYDEKLVVVLQEAIDALNRCKESGIDDVFEDTLSRMAPGKRVLVDRPYISDACFLKEWREQEYEKMGFKTESPEFYTRNGLRVRSKSEVIIADMLDEMNIPFLYEKPLKLRSVTVHPDFTLLDAANRREIYWEHFGMMDDADYRNNAFCKMREYEENGIYQHDRLIWTFETGRQPIDTRALRKMIKRLGVMLGYEGN